MTLSKGVAELVATSLANAGLGVLGTSVFHGWIPDTPDNCIVVLDSTPKAINRKCPIINFPIIVLVFNAEKNNAESKAQETRETLQNLQIPISNTELKIVQISAQNLPEFSGIETGNNRMQYIFDATILAKKLL